MIIRRAALTAKARRVSLHHMKLRVAAFTFITTIALTTISVQAKEAACCANGKTAKKTMCADYAKLNLSAEQKTKLTALQEKCMKDGCTEKTRAKFLKSAQRILSADQYAQLKAECERPEKKQG